MVENEYSLIKGQEFKNLLDESMEQIKNGNFELANVNLKIFIDFVPDNTPAADYLRNRLRLLDAYNKKVIGALDKIISGTGNRLLEINDAIEEKKRQSLRYIIEKRKICENVFLRYKLYENNSTVEYEL